MKEAIAALVVALVAVLSGCGGGSVEPYETRDGSATRLDGTKVTIPALAVSEAIRLRPQEPFYVRGYLIAPPDDEDMLCERLQETGDCRGAPALVVDTSRVDLWGAKALEEGCCAIGLWSPHPVVLRVNLRHGNRAVVLG